MKYGRPFAIKNVARLIITTNKANPVPMDVASGKLLLVSYKVIKLVKLYFLNR